MVYGATPGILSSDTARTWGDRIKEWRLTRGLSTDELARLLNVGPKVVVEWEKGTRSVTQEMQYVSRLRVLQEEAGETPGFDLREQVAGLWDIYRRQGTRG